MRIFARELVLVLALEVLLAVKDALNSSSRASGSTVDFPAPVSAVRTSAWLGEALRVEVIFLRCSVMGKCEIEGGMFIIRVYH